MSTDRIADFEKLIVQLGREQHLIEYKKGHFIRKINGHIGIQYSIRSATANKELFFTNKQQLSLILSKLVADRYSSTKG